MLRPFKAMKPNPRPRIKICCMGSIEEAWMAIDHGASAVGLVSAMPSGPGVIEEALIAQIAAALPPAIGSFLLTSKQDADAIIEQQRRLGVNTLQICDRLETGSYADLRQALPGISLVQVVHVTGTKSLDEAKSVAPFVDAILLDSGNQSLAVKELGGTGRVHNWTISRRIRESVEVPIFLAGGLNHMNVAQCIEEVGPFGVDVCSGVRTDGKLDPMKLDRFFAAIEQKISGNLINASRQTSLSAQS
jgi:phosphoribosylanthranilate isomerase